MFYARTPELHSSNLGRNSYIHWGFSRFSSVPLGKCSDNTPITPQQLPNLYQFIIYKSFYYRTLCSLRHWDCCRTTKRERIRFKWTIGSIHSVIEVRSYSSCVADACLVYMTNNISLWRNTESLYQCTYVALQMCWECWVSGSWPPEPGWGINCGSCRG
jgi:hypothetical protein